MTKLLAFLLIIFLVVGAAYAKGYEVKTDRNPPVIGDNDIEIGIKEAEEVRIFSPVIISFQVCLKVTMSGN
jgi:hypothetical protein